MLLSVEGNPNCPVLDCSRFQESGPPRPISHILLERGGRRLWCPVSGMDASFQARPACAVRVGDSGEGEVTLAFGGEWGLRLKEPECAHPWSGEDPHQWGLSHLLLAGDGSLLRWA